MKPRLITKTYSWPIDIEKYCRDNLVEVLQTKKKQITEESLKRERLLWEKIFSTKYEDYLNQQIMKAFNNMEICK